MLLCEKNESAGDKAGHADKRTRGDGDRGENKERESGGESSRKADESGDESSPQNEREEMKKDDRQLITSIEHMCMHVNMVASECCLCVAPIFIRQCMYVCMCWQAGVTSGFHEGLSRQRAAKYSIEGIRGNLLIREKRVNLRSCNCKWRWGLSEGLSVSLQGEYKQARSGSLAHMHACVRHSHKHTRRHANTSTHE